MPHCVVLNYFHPDYPAGAVLLLDTELDYEFSKIADTFDQFINKLGPDPDYEPGEDEIPDIRLATRTGPLSPLVTEALEITGLDDGGRLFRTAMWQLTQDDTFMVENTKQGRAVFDMMFWLVTQFRRVHSPGDFENAEKDYTQPSFATLAAGLFDIQPSMWGPSWSSGAIEMWWEYAVKENKFRDTGDGFVFTDDYISTMMSNLRGHAHELD